ncbi:hypothetical protein N8927_03275 [Crocinitomicaceae bacterium]|nr:hypothetical protein [Crocinitomicaceae bacterium]
MKTLLSFIALFLLLCNTYGQTLSDVTIDLNPGGEVYDVAYDSFRDLYIVVGDFNSIQGQARNNFALIDASTLQVTNENPITSINGVIRTVEYIHYTAPFPQFQEYDYIYIGGDFTSINGNNGGSISQTYITRLSFATGTLNSTSYSVNNFDPDNYFMNVGQYLGVGVNDLLIAGDTLIVVGDILYDDGIIYSSNIIGFSAVSGTASGTYMASFFQDYYPDVTYSCSDINFGQDHWNIREANNGFYINGNSHFDYNGVFTNSNYDFQNCGSVTCNMYDMEIHESSVDTLVIGFKRYAAASGAVVYELDGTQLNCPFANTIPNIMTYSNGTSSDGFIETYKDYVFIAEESQLDVFERTSTTPINPSTSFIGNPFWRGNMNDDVWNPQKIKRMRNRLFVSGPSLTEIDSEPRTGLAVICLEPEDPAVFNDFDSTICEGETVLYSIPSPNYAEGYRWAYTGTGAQYRIYNSGDPFQPFASEIITSTAIEVYYPTGATNGVLSVEAYATCNTATDYLFSNALNMNIMVTPLPDLTIPENIMYFTCNESALDLTAQSSTILVTWEWTNNTFVVGNTNIVSVDLTDNVIDSSYFYITVTEPINFCESNDSIQVIYDTLAAPVNVASIAPVPTVFNCSTDSLYMTNTTMDAAVNWALNTDPNNLLSGYTIYDANDSLDVICYLTYDANGCTAQQSYTIQTDVQSLGGEIVGYTGSIPLDTLDCNNPSLTLECEITSGNGTVDWIIGGAPSGTILNLSEADTAGMTSLGLQTYVYTTTNLDNGCTANYNAVVYFDFTPPFVVPYSGPSSINCSASDLELVHTLSGGNVIEGWLDASGVNTLDNTLFTNSIGSYVYEVVSLDNGCVAEDVVDVELTTELLLLLQEDILLCDGQTASISVSPINNMEATTYTWSNGEIGQVIDVTGGIDNELSVIAENASGCIGYDTIQVITASAIVAELEASSGCTGGAIQVLSVTGGTGNYSYSMDQSTWQSDPVFSDLAFGMQTIFIQDDLGCVYSFDAVIDANTSSYDINFLASTYNVQGDTIAIVNISNYSGFDSIQWVLPMGAIVHSIDDSMLVMSMDVEGWYDITMIGHQDTCQYAFTNAVYFGDYAPVFDENYEQMGITSVLVYPNPTLLSGAPPGFFNVDIELGVAQNYAVLVTNMSGQPVPGMSQSGVGQSLSIEFTFPIGTTPGPYVIHIIADYDAQQENIILN